jgi:hypothetical protein
MSPISFTQRGIVTQYALAIVLILTSDGRLEVAVPLTDDDRRDMEIHIRGKFARSIALQVKSTTHLEHRFKAYQLSMFFLVPKDKLISHPNWADWLGLGTRLNPVSGEFHASSMPRSHRAFHFPVRALARAGLAPRHPRG